ncbi:MAG: TonB-dependent receptor plug domain-containing protein [Haliea sp.]
MKPAQPSITSLLTTTLSLSVSAGALAGDIDLESTAIEREHDPVEQVMYISPARMASSFLDSPNAVTSLDIATLRKLGITEVVDALRLVPGMTASETHGSDVSVGYHGANVNVPRRSEILYNSNRLHRPGYAGAHWYRLPIDLQDLNYIEVIRGTSPEYGTNSMTSTVNLIQDTIATRGMSASARAGDADTRDIFVHGGWLIGDNQIGLRYFHRSNAGFDGAEGQQGPYNNDVSTDSIMLNLEHRINDTWLLDVAGSYADSSYQIPGFEHLQADDSFVDLALSQFRISPDAKETAGFLSTKVHGIVHTAAVSHELVFGFNASTFSRDQAISLCGNNFTFDPRVADIDALPSVNFTVSDGGAIIAAMITGNLRLDQSIVQTPTASETAKIDALGPYLQTQGLSLLQERCGVTDQDLSESRYEVNTYVVSQLTDSLKNSFGVSYTLNDITAQTYLGGSVDQHAVQLHDTLRYTPDSRWVLNGTLAAETASNVDVSAAWSYRLAANYQLRQDVVLRLMHSKSERLPDVYETDRDWRYFVSYDPGEVDHLGRNAGYLTRRALSPDNLKPEELETTELGITISRFNRLQADLKIFYEDYTQLISEPFNYVDFRLSNNGALRNQGFEVGIHQQTDQGFEWGASYLYLDADTDTPFEATLRSTHSGSLWGIVPLSRDTDLSAVYYGASNVADGSYDRFDATLSHRIAWSHGDLDLQLNYRHYPKGIHAFTELSAVDPNIALVEGRDRIFFTVKASFF